MSTPPLADDFGAWLRWLRRQRDRTQEALADEVGCAVYTLRAIETGRRRPSRELAERLAAVLGLPEGEWPRFVQLARSGQAPEDEGPALEGPSPTPPTAPLPELLSTKLYTPPPPLHAVPRARLLALLAARPARLTLVVAPPGFGKSTLLAQLLAQPGERLDSSGADSVLRSAWLSLDADDDEPARFLSAVIAALQQQLPGLGTGALNLLHMAPGAQPQAVLAALINDLRGRDAALALVLDDYHTINSPAVHELLTTLVERGPPGLRLLLAARSDPPLPIARWRARGLLAEVRAADLRFDHDEAAAFLVDGWGLALSAEQVALLEARTEGWAAGLQLAGLSLQGRADPTAFLSAFGGGNRYVLDYLIAETLGSLPGHLHSFLLQTAILRRLSAPLCDAVLGLSASVDEHEAYSRVLLAELERRNLFLIPLDDEGRWWRYHHLFSEVLLAQLKMGGGAGKVATLHHRAAQWYEAGGEYEEALHHASAAGDPALAAILLARLAPQLMNQGALQTLRGQLQLLPLEHLKQHPALIAYAIWTLVEVGQLGEAEQLIGSVAAPDDTTDPATRSYLLGARARIAVVREQYLTSVVAAREALALLGANDPLFRCELLFLLANACESNDDLPGALAAAQAAAALCRQQGRSTFSAEVQISNLLAIQGRSVEAEGRIREVISLCVDSRGSPTPLASVPMVVLARLRFERGAFAEGRALAEQAYELALAHSFTYTALYAAWLLAHIHLCLRHHAAAQHAIGLLQALTVQADSSYWSRVAEALAGELALLARDTSAAEQWATQALAHLRQLPDLSSRRGDQVMSCAKLLLSLGRAEEALPLVQRMHQTMRAAGRWRTVVIAQLHEALALDALGQHEHALRTLAEAVQLAAAQEAVSHFLDLPPAVAGLLPAVRHVAPAFVDRVLALLREAHGDPPAALPQPLGRPDASTPHGLDEPLSARELEVLRLLALGRSNQAIADELIIAVGTVKRHLHSIFGKLGVDSRTEAIARAHALRLIVPTTG